MVKLIDIAKASGVSIATVSAAINRTAGVSEERRRHILGIASELGYSPNIAARLLKRNRVDDLVLIVNEFNEKIVGSGVYHSVINSFVTECAGEGIRNQIEFTDMCRDELPHCISGGLAGGAIHIGLMSEKMRNWLERHPDFPLVQLEEPFQYSVVSDVESGIQQSLQYLAALGHRRIALLHGPRRFMLHKLFYSFFIQVAREFQLELNDDFLIELQQQDNRGSVEEARHAAELLLRRPDRPTAIICGGMPIATAVIYSALKNGLDVPGDLSVIASAADWEGDKCCPALTTIERDWSAMVAIAMKILRRLQNHLEVDASQIKLSMKLVKRETVSTCKQ